MFYEYRRLVKMPVLTLTQKHKRLLYRAGLHSRIELILPGRFSVDGIWQRLRPDDQDSAATRPGM